jgi:peptidoglycan/xylan/chitin deacetylase (PgdA/CDA1 family)
MDLKHRGLDLAFRAMAGVRADRWATPFARGIGAILMVHRVRPTPPDGFAPNRSLEITPDFLDRVLTLAREQGFDLVSLDEAIHRLRTYGKSDAPARFFVTLTFDDGYRDTVDVAWPILARHRAPWTMYVTTGFAEGTANLWWIELEEALRRVHRVELDLDGRLFTASTTTDDEKQRAFRRIYWSLRKGPEENLRAAIAALSARAGVNSPALTRELCLSWDVIRALAGAPDVTIGAHTLTHPMLAKHPPMIATAEIAESRRRLEAELGQRVVHFAYPVGDRRSAGPREFQMAADAGFTSAVTTRPGHLFAGHADHLQALPRVSLNGLHQSDAAIRALFSGLPFLLWNRGRSVDIGA